MPKENPARLSVPALVVGDLLEARVAAAQAVLQADLSEVLALAAKALMRPISLRNFSVRAGEAKAKKRGPEPGPDIKVVAKITLAESLTGTTTRVSLPTGRTIEVKVPAGVTEGKVIRLKRQGHASPMGGPPGDAYVTIHIAQDHRFQVDGKNLKVRVQIPLEDAVLGGRVRVPTLEGAVELSIPPYSSSGQTLRLRGKGVPAEDGAGDLMVTLEVTIPKEPDLELEMLMKRWRDRKPR